MIEERPGGQPLLDCDPIYGAVFMPGARTWVRKEQRRISVRKVLRHRGRLHTALRHIWRRHISLMHWGLLHKRQPFCCAWPSWSGLRGTYAQQVRTLPMQPLE